MTEKRTAARVVIAGSGGDSGKTLVSMGLIASWRRRGHQVVAFKKGPDYIDAAWLEFAAGHEARNLDTYIMGVEGVQRSFEQNCRRADVSLIEGNRGLFDGLDVRGTHSTAELAKLLHAPVILVLNVTKVTRTAASVVLGCLKLDPEVNIAGVILNNVAGQRHETIIRESIESICGVPVLGAIPKISGESCLPGRHLGLITPAEHPGTGGLKEKIADIADRHIDGGRILEIAYGAPALRKSSRSTAGSTSEIEKSVRIAYFRDSAFTFYYPENLEALQTAGAELIPVSSLRSASLPPCDGLYIGGGFPETHAGRLSENHSLLTDVHRQAHEGLPIFAECGGLIFLCRSISYENKTFALAGVFPLDLQMMPKPQGHGYMEVEVDTENPFFSVNTVIRGHEFHYSKVITGSDQANSIYAVKRGQGCFGHRDGLAFSNVLASYLHIHAIGTPIWAKNFVKLARDHHNHGK